MDDFQGVFCLGISMISCSVYYRISTALPKTNNSDLVSLLPLIQRFLTRCSWAAGGVSPFLAVPPSSFFRCGASRRSCCWCFRPSLPAASLSSTAWSVFRRRFRRRSSDSFVLVQSGYGGLCFQSSGSLNINCLGCDLEIRRFLHAGGWVFSFLYVYVWCLYFLLLCFVQSWYGGCRFGFCSGCKPVRAVWLPTLWTR